MALELRPNCECCDKDLPNGHEEAMICSYECTFCKTCVDEILLNVCPNCGGGFAPVQQDLQLNNVKEQALSISHHLTSAEIQNIHKKNSPLFVNPYQKFHLKKDKR